jgi:hypothetical protein
LDLRFADNKTLGDAVGGGSPVTFTRASTGTFIGSDGLLKTAAVDAPRFDHSITSSTTNLLTWSEDITNTGWSLPVGGSRSSNQEAAPDGTLTADYFTSTGGGDLLRKSVTVTSGTTYTVSVYVRSVSGVTSFRLDLGDGAEFSGTLTSSWQRFVYTVAATAAQYIDFRLTGAGTVAIWGAQLEQSSTVGPYVPTTTAAATSNTTESLGLLVEEARTNSTLQSNAFTTTWGNTNVTLTSNSATSPAGDADGWLFANNTTTGNHNIGQGIAFTAAATTVSVFVKYLDHRWVGIRMGATGNQFFGSWDLQNGVVGSVTAGATIGMQAVGNGWYRLTLTATLTTAGSANCIFGLNNADAIALTSYAGTGTGIYIFGAQLEAGAFPTSYIPTTTATVTRAADVASITGSSFSSFYNQTEGTVYGEGSTFNTGASSCLVSIDDTTSNNRIQLRRSTSASTLRMVSSGGSIDANLTTGTALGANKIATGVSASNQNLVSNGAIATGITSITPMPTVTQVQIGNGPASTAFNGTIKRLTYWPVRLANTTLQQITQ